MKIPEFSEFRRFTNQPFETEMLSNCVSKRSIVIVIGMVEKRVSILLILLEGLLTI